MPTSYQRAVFYETLQQARCLVRTEVAEANDIATANAAMLPNIGADHLLLLQPIEASLANVLIRLTHLPVDPGR